MEGVYILIVFCVLCCLLPSIGLGIMVALSDDDENGSGNGSCTTPVDDKYSLENVSGSIGVDSFNLTDITCATGYTGPAVANVCSASGTPYTLTGCSPVVPDDDCSSRFPDPIDETYNIIEGVDITNFDLTSIDLSGDINCSRVGNITCNSNIGASGIISCSGTSLPNTSGTISCSGTSGTGVFYLSGCGAATATHDCTDDQYLTNGQCVGLTVCSTGQYEATAPTSTVDRECALLTQCTAEEYETTPPTATSNRVCDNLTVCSVTNPQTNGPIQCEGGDTTSYCSDRQCTHDCTENVECLNDGTCAVNSCTCVGGYTGNTCQTQPDLCQHPDPINCNHGTCNAGNCNCEPGYTGVRCLTPPDPVDCVFSAVSAADCTDQCGTLTPTITTPASHGGVCGAVPYVCNHGDGDCQPVNCEETGNTPEDCLETCALATATVTTEPRNGGDPCDGDYTCVAGDGNCRRGAGCENHFNYNTEIQYCCRNQGDWDIGCELLFKNIDNSEGVGGGGWRARAQRVAAFRAGTLKRGRGPLSMLSEENTQYRQNSMASPEDLATIQDTTCRLSLLYAYAKGESTAACQPETNRMAGLNTFLMSGGGLLGGYAKWTSAPAHNSYSGQYPCSPATLNSFCTGGPIPEVTGFDGRLVRPPGGIYQLVFN